MAHKGYGACDFWRPVGNQGEGDEREKEEEKSGGYELDWKERLAKQSRFCTRDSIVGRVVIGYRRVGKHTPQNFPFVAEAPRSKHSIYEHEILFCFCLQERCSPSIELRKPIPVFMRRPMGYYAFTAYRCQWKVDRLCLACAVCGKVIGAPIEMTEAETSISLWSMSRSPDQETAK
ncbi:hypothetical protein B0H19DRAFT_1076491 [Mycena capillaripes]|nr:hypothetical protein B0H19DRAFT_1076491 [Mycena capillaripes]